MSLIFSGRSPPPILKSLPAVARTERGGSNKKPSIEPNRARTYHGDLAQVDFPAYVMKQLKFEHLIAPFFYFVLIVLARPVFRCSIIVFFHPT